MKLSCNVARDLLPLYHDGVCSGESCELVEAHLKDCPDCAAILQELRGEIELSHDAPNDGAVLKKLERNVRKGKKRAWLRGMAVVLAVVLLLFAAVNIWWYTQVYQFYAQFAEGKPQVMMHEYDPDTGEVINSRPMDASTYKWHTENNQYYHVVHLPDYLQRNGEVALHYLRDWTIRNTAGDQEQTVRIRVYIGRELYTYSVHLTITDHASPSWEPSDEVCVMLDKDLNQVYLDHWNEEIRTKQDALLEEYHEQIIAIIEAAQAEWPVLTR